MSSPQQSWFKSGLRFCGSCFVSLLFWAVWLTLSATLAVLVYILIARELPVPDFVLRRMESKLAEANLTINFGNARLDPTGKLLLENVQLRSKQFNEPLLTSRLVYLRRSFWSILAGRPLPDEIRLEGATLQLPAMLSPSGIAEPLVRDLSAVIQYDQDNVWNVDQLTCRVGRLKITAEGNFGTPQHVAGAQSPSPEKITAQFLQIGRRLILEVSKLEAFEEPSLSVQLDSQSGTLNTATCVFTADAAIHPWAQSFTLGSVIAKATLRFDGRKEQIIRINASTRKISDGRVYKLDSVNAFVSARIGAEKPGIQPIDASIAIGSMSAEDELISGPVIYADLKNWPLIKLVSNLQVGKEFIGAGVDADLEKKSAHITIDGSGDPEIINRVLEKHTPRAAPFFIFEDKVTVNAEAVLSAGWHFEQLTSRVTAGRINSRDVKITSARGRIDIKGSDFLAYEAQVEMDQNVARGSYWMNFATTDYRMLLKGRLLPPKISGWFNGDWWTDFWNQHFEFPTDLPEGDVDVQGRWRDVSRTEYFGLANASAASVWGGKFDRVQALIFLRPLYTHIIEFSGIRAKGAQKLRGSLKRFADAEKRESSRLEFDLDGNIDPETYHGMLDGKADEVFSSLKFVAPPHVHATGSLIAQGIETSADYKFTGQAEGGIRYYDFPLDSVRVTGSVNGSDVRLEDIQLTALGGTGAGKAALTGPIDSRRLGFDLYLNNADLPQTIRAVQEYQKSHSLEKSPAGVDNSLIKRASGGRLDLALSALGIADDLNSFIGTGNAAVNGANLGEIQLFGLLSQVLSGLSLNFSSLKLDSAHTSFRMEKGRLRFPDLKITGPSAVIDAHGDFVFATSELDFTAKFKPFEESKNLLTAAIGIVINPITSILELKLTGPLNKPNWSIDVGSLSQRHESSLKEKNPEQTPAK